MANWGIRVAVRERVRILSPDQLAEVITDTQNSQEEKNLPGLGVLFELLWQGSSSHHRKEALSIIHQELQRSPQTASKDEVSHLAKS